MKPEEWLDDEPLTIPDPGKQTSHNNDFALIAIFEDATKPEEWDDEEDGDWIAPTVPNPKCADAAGCGEWKRFVNTTNVLPEPSLINDLVLSRPTLTTKVNGTLLKSTTLPIKVSGHPARSLTQTTSKIWLPSSRWRRL